MPGHLLLYHPGVIKLKELVETGELGDVLCVYGNRQNLGIVRTNENALWSLGVHDLSVILYLLDEDPMSRPRTAARRPDDGVEDVVFCYLRFPSGKIAHMHLSWLDPHKMRKMTVVGREKMAVFDDMELGAQGDDLREGAREPAELRRVATRPATSSSRRSRTTSRCGSSARYFLRLVDGTAATAARSPGTAPRVVRALEMLTSSLGNG